MSKKGKKFLVKIHPKFQQSQARDVESGVMFTKYDAVEIGEDIWDRLKGKEWSLDGKSFPLLVEADSSESLEEDDESKDAPGEADVEDSAGDGSVLQDTEVEEE